MPEKETIERARSAERAGKAPTTQAGEFVREEMEHIRAGKHGARSPKQVIAIGLSKARRAGVKLPPPSQGKTSDETRKKAEHDYIRGQSAHRGSTSPKRSRAVSRALKRESRQAASPSALRVKRVPLLVAEARPAANARQKRRCARRTVPACVEPREKRPARGRLVGELAVNNARYQSFCRAGWGFRRSRTLVPEGTEGPSGMNPTPSKRSDAGASIFQEVFDFVKRVLSGARERSAEARTSGLQRRLSVYSQRDVGSL